ncbi:MAG: nucleotidyltransferase family protein [Mucilaginibacter sp.]
MEAIILAGGLGTRLRDIVKDIPKPMAPINGTPFLHYIFEWLSNFPVNNVTLSIGYKADVIFNHFNTNYKGISIKYATENKPLGTGGAIKYALSKTVEDNVLIVNGDTYFPIDVNRFADFHQNNKSDISIALKHMTDFDRYGSVKILNNKIISFNEKQHLREGLINGGIYIVNKKAINFNSLPDVFSFEAEVLEKCVHYGSINGMIFNDTFIDIGVPEDYKKACMML